MAKRDQPSGRSLDRRPEDWFEPRLPGSASTDDIAAALAAVDINTTAPITGGGNLDSDLTLSLSGTKAQFNASCSDGDFLYVGDITQYTDEMARDALGIALTAGAGITITPNDPADMITIASSITQYTDEMVRDVMGVALVAGVNITITPNDGADTITIDAAGASGYTDEQVRDVIGVALTNGTGINIVVSDPGDTITINSTITQYTDEQAQDAVGAMIADTATIDLTYTDATPELKADVKANSIGVSQLDITSNSAIDYALHKLCGGI